MIHIKLTIMALLWAGGFIAGKSIALLAGPFTISFFRFSIATVVLVALVLLKGQYQRVTRTQVCYALLAAFFGDLCYNFLFFSALRLVDAGRCSVIISTVPIVILIVSCLLFQEKISRAKSVGIILSLIGAWIVICRGDFGAMESQTIGWGEVNMIGAVICATMFTLLSKRLLADLSPLLTMALISVFGTVFLIVPAAVEMQTIPVLAGAQGFLPNLLYLSVGPTVIALTIYYEAIRQVGPARASQYMNLMPVFAVVLSFVFLGEHLSASLLVGGGIVTSGLWLTNITS